MFDNLEKAGKLKHSSQQKKRVTTALLLAAGTGSRLFPLTQNAPKCLTLVNGIPILERLTSSLILHGFSRLVVVTGHLEEHIRDFLGSRIGDLRIDYVFSPLYKQTNNIYSLWMARPVINEPFLLLESDLVFDNSLLDDMIYPDRIAVARMQPWMNGTCVTIDQSQHVARFLANDETSLAEDRYKTVNIYSISLNSWNAIIERLDRHISDGNVNAYYEIVFAEMVADGILSFEVVSFDGKPWYEIDTVEDLAMAEKRLLTVVPAIAGLVPLSRSDFLNKKFVHTGTSPKQTTGILNLTNQR